MAGCTVVLLEKLISMEFLLGYCRIISAKPFVETRIRSDQSAFELLYRICNVCLGDSIRINLQELPAELPVSLELCDDVIE